MVKAALLDLRLGPLGGDTLGNKGGAWTGLEVRDRHTHTHTLGRLLYPPLTSAAYLAWYSVSCGFSLGSVQ